MRPHRPPISFTNACSVLQCVAASYSELQRVATVSCRVLQPLSFSKTLRVLQCVTVALCVAVCRSVLQCVAVCLIVLQLVAVCCNVLQYAERCHNVLRYVTMLCIILQCVAVCRMCHKAFHYIATCLVYCCTPCCAPCCMPLHAKSQSQTLQTILYSVPHGCNIGCNTQACMHQMSHAATRCCLTLLHPATLCNSLPHTAARHSLSTAVHAVFIIFFCCFQGKNKA